MSDSCDLSDQTVLSDCINLSDHSDFIDQNYFNYWSGQIDFSDLSYLSDLSDQIV